MVEGQKQNIQFDIDILFYLYFTLDLRTTNSWIMTHESTYREQALTEDGS